MKAIDSTQELQAARADVERLRKALEKLMLCSHSPTGRACNCYRQADAALRKSSVTPLVMKEKP